MDIFATGSIPNQLGAFVCDCEVNTVWAFWPGQAYSPGRGKHGDRLSQTVLKAQTQQLFDGGTSGYGHSDIFYLFTSHYNVVKKGLPDEETETVEEIKTTEWKNMVSTKLKI